MILVCYLKCAIVYQYEGDTSKVVIYTPHCVCPELQSQYYLQ